MKRWVSESDQCLMFNGGLFHCLELTMNWCEHETALQVLLCPHCWAKAAAVLNDVSESFQPWSQSNPRHLSRFSCSSTKQQKSAAKVSSNLDDTDVPILVPVSWPLHVCPQSNSESRAAEADGGAWRAAGGAEEAVAGGVPGRPLQEQLPAAGPTSVPSSACVESLTVVAASFLWPFRIYRS